MFYNTLSLLPESIPGRGPNTGISGGNPVASTPFKSGFPFSFSSEHFPKAPKETADDESGYSKIRDRMFALKAKAGHLPPWCPVKKKYGNQLEIHIQRYHSSVAEDNEVCIPSLQSQT